MTGTKVLLIVLILFVVLFICFIIWGAGGKPEGNKDSKSQAKEFNSQPHPTLEAFSGLLTPFSPRLQASQLQPSLKVFDLQSAPLYAVRILPDSDHKIRQATFSLRQNNACGHVVYGDQDNLDKDNKNPNKFTFAIHEEGGILNIGRNPNIPTGPCEVRLQ